MVIFLTNSIRSKAVSIRNVPLTVNQGKKGLFFAVYHLPFTAVVNGKWRYMVNGIRYGDK